MKKFVKGFVYAWSGLCYAFCTQLNFRIHGFATILTMIAGWALHISSQEWLWIALCIALVWAAELFNTALETLTDVASPGWNEKAGQAKDISAAAVAVMALFALVVAGVIFVPKLLSCCL